MKVAQLLEKRRAGWAELETMCRTLESGGTRRLGPEGVLRFATAYRSACADLALADAYQLPPHTVQYLHDLVGRAHNQLYRSKMFRWRQWGHELFVEVPRRLLFDRTLWLATAVFWGIFFASMALGYSSRSYCEDTVGVDALASVEQSFATPPRGRDANTSGAMGGFYVFNNAGIGLRCFAGGLVLGVGGLLITISNAIQLGAIFGHMFTVEARDNFIEFVTAHGPFELTAIVFSSAAGMRLGFALVDTGGLSRIKSLQRAVYQAVPTMAMAVILFCLAAVIEGFISPSSLPYAAKAGVAVVSTILLLLYVFGLGWLGRPRRAV
ncbi:MAG: stage II sporulation protein M [Planctomycetota bacterium]|nr:MAG: stage II sporulation protein M [Planctomycetota bacterium]